MFGMSDPNQTLSQMIRYFEEQRYEMVEVMSSEFTAMLLSQKGRDAARSGIKISLCIDNKRVRIWPVGDPHLAAIQNKPVIALFSVQLHPDHI